LKSPTTDVGGLRLTIDVVKEGEEAVVVVVEVETMEY
jgi:hypothetical protein